MGMAAPAGSASALSWVVGTSCVLHVLVVAALIWQPDFGPDGPPTELATVQVEYVNQLGTTKGAPAPDDKADPDPAPPGGAVAEETTPPPPAPAPVDLFADVPMPPDVPETQVAAANTGHPSVNLGDSDADRDTLTVTGDNVVSSGPDAAYRNMPPSFPHEAVRRHQQGSVQVMVHITPGGVVGDVEMITSSGSEALDGAARDAVLRWHFKPALRDGVPVASIYKLQMNFRSQLQ
jgi:protein TonB